MVINIARENKTEAAGRRSRDGSGHSSVPSKVSIPGNPTGGGTVETVPPHPQNERAKDTECSALTREVVFAEVDVGEIIVGLLLLKASHARSNDIDPDKSRSTTNHVDDTRAGEIDDGD